MSAPMRISVTTLESFRLYMDPDQDWMPESELIATIKGEFTPTPKIELGLAFGQVLEKPEEYSDIDGGYRHGRFFFSDEMIAPALELFDRRGVFEAKTTKPFAGAIVVAKADQILGIEIVENKTTIGGFRFDKYAESYQWRFELDLFEAASVTYHVFCLDEDPDGEIELKSIETFTFYPYAEMRRDCEIMVRRFTDYVKMRGLDELLRQRQIEAESRAVFV